MMVKAITRSCNFQLSLASVTINIGGFDMATMNFLLTGRPGVGKTTVIIRLAALLGGKAVGFYTAELRAGERRVGFEVATLGGKRAVLAHVDFASGVRVGKYGVRPESLAAALGEVSAALADRVDKYILIDEIGKMELLSDAFRHLVWQALESPFPVVATILAGPNPFADAVRRRRDVRLIKVTPANRDNLPYELQRELNACF
ncbi:MAG: Nucleoside-triphosphatase [Clostridia bacterium 62_21]|nr:MAG: Nucleoside-triphosphatase [Clostridia bacterium 62_21]